jgi:hypothetical protein
MEHFEWNFLSYLLITTIAILVVIVWGMRNNEELQANEYKRLDIQNDNLIEKHDNLKEKSERLKYKKEEFEKKAQILDEEITKLRIAISGFKNLHDWNEMKENKRLVHAARDLQKQIDELHELHCIQRKQLTTIITNPTEPVSPLAPVKVEPFK